MRHVTLALMLISSVSSDNVFAGSRRRVTPEPRSLDPIAPLAVQQQPAQGTSAKLQGEVSYDAIRPFEQEDDSERAAGAAIDCLTAFGPAEKETLDGPRHCSSDTLHSHAKVPLFQSSGPKWSYSRLPIGPSALVHLINRVQQQACRKLVVFDETTISYKEPIAVGRPSLNRLNDAGIANLAIVRVGHNGADPRKIQERLDGFGVRFGIRKKDSLRMIKDSHRPIYTSNENIGEVLIQYLKSIRHEGEYNCIFFVSNDKTFKNHVSIIKAFKGNPDMRINLNGSYRINSDINIDIDKIKNLLAHGKRSP